ncbi:hypothetical protein HanXRQr2_Chr15g0679041 [Helianthus annuus]|uniref:Uncharacterized protein n=1 Tax=Helianthus annuus TaxID=4232 RepID=A0A9K3DXL6_HELAN|nr:hypothetical protein HanXRQr2_Chr15g0679041 [Helianthus annuus]KAJ0472006.1 hypothetical protein HanHA89_Chr15g0602231 [Helianthus annuus]KAJ0647596.1 hypothetical protein HanLR1_Chr15g0563531 [Helianthus annuus]KAJ0651478.1 hypothetical protein HanOQP8_Chr15g0561391 [Helianthus annuus]KAJ0830073.1 hypothetical protein HanPSC8_Chr15g0651021 [Helianthus annuus]
MVRQLSCGRCFSIHNRTSMQSFLILGLGRMSLWKIKPMYQHRLWRHMDMQHSSMSSMVSE